MEVGKDRNRSVLDYPTEPALKAALSSMRSSSATSYPSPLSSPPLVPAARGDANARTASSDSKMKSNDRECESPMSTTVSSEDGEASIPEQQQDQKEAQRVENDASSGSSPQQQQKTQQPIAPHLDWKLENVEEDAMEQTLAHEMKRLLVLKSYMLLEAAQSPGFGITSIRSNNNNNNNNRATLNRLTSMASRTFHVPLCQIALIDLGRAVVISGHGCLAEEAKRRDAFCAHTILCKKDVFVVPDATLDDRFKDNEHVKGEGGIRFYAGSPLQSPEGFNLGAFAVMDRKPRPQGLSPDEEASLRDMAQLAVDAFVLQKRIQEQQQKLQTASRLLTSASHDLTTPLSALQLSLSLLHGDPSFQAHLSPHQREYLATISSCSTAMGAVCEALRVQNRGQVDILNAVIEEGAAVCASESGNNDELNHHLDSSSGNSSVGTTVDARRVCDIPQVVDKIHQALSALPAKVPVAISVEPTVPSKILSNDLQLFRILLDLLAHACERTNTGSICLTIRVQESKAGEEWRRELLFDCKDSGPTIQPASSSQLNNKTATVVAAATTGDIPISSESPSPLQPQQLESNVSHKPQPTSTTESTTDPTRLEFVKSAVRRLGGHFGIETSSDDASKTHKTSFWFSIPLIEPTAQHESDRIKRSISDLSTSSAMFHHSSTGNHINSNSPKRVRTESFVFMNSFAHPRNLEVMKPKRALVIDDSLVVRKVLAKALSRLGFEASQAVDGMEGLRKMQSTKFDLVLCDFLMPVMDGLDCVREYRRWESQNRPHFKQFIVGMSAHASSKDVERGLKLGMDDYRPKPVTLDVLKSLELSIQGMARSESTDTVGSARRRMCASPTSLRLMENDQDASKVCLIATADQASRHHIGDIAAQYGWNSVSAESGPEALILLKRRNWGAALLDSDLLDLSGLSCISQFREWEKKNRVHRQNNIYLLSADLSEFSRINGSVSFVQVPDGVDGAMDRPPRREDLEGVFRNFEGRVQSFQATDIVTR